MEHQAREVLHPVLIFRYFSILLITVVKMFFLYIRNSFRVDSGISAFINEFHLLFYPIELVFSICRPVFWKLFSFDSWMLVFQCPVQPIYFGLNNSIKDNSFNRNIFFRPNFVFFSSVWIIFGVVFMWIIVKLSYRKCQTIIVTSIRKL